MHASLICHCSGTSAICPEIYSCPLFPVLDLLLILCSQCTGSEYLPVILIKSFKHIQHVQHPIRIGNQKRAISVRIVPCFGYHLNKTLYNSQQTKCSWYKTSLFKTAFNFKTTFQKVMCMKNYVFTRRK